VSTYCALYPCVAALTTCSSCEYREGCEWREMKAREAQEKYVERKSRQMEDSGDFDAT
jgi:hypothetical protein